MAENKKTEGLIYKNHPLRRIDNIIYYGSMADKYIIMRSGCPIWECGSSTAS